LSKFFGNSFDKSLLQIGHFKLRKTIKQFTQIQCLQFVLVI
jgi:hypothetical protein